MQTGGYAIEAEARTRRVPQPGSRARRLNCGLSGNDRGGRASPFGRVREVAVTADMETSIRASRRRVARSRGALSGILLMVLGLWAAFVPFIGPYFNLAYSPRPNDAWHWTAARGWLEVLPGAAAFLGG